MGLYSSQFWESEIKELKLVGASCFVTTWWGVLHGKRAEEREREKERASYPQTMWE
jgi:hypothetical protein